MTKNTDARSVYPSISYLFISVSAVSSSAPRTAFIEFQEAERFSRPGSPQCSPPYTPRGFPFSWFSE